MSGSAQITVTLRPARASDIARLAVTVDFPSPAEAPVTTNAVAARLEAAARKPMRSGTKASEIEVYSLGETVVVDRFRSSAGSEGIRARADDRRYGSASSTERSLSSRRPRSPA